MGLMAGCHCLLAGEGMCLSWNARCGASQIFFQTIRILVICFVDFFCFSVNLNFIDLVHLLHFPPANGLVRI